MKRALIVTYYWPPAGGPGVQRWLKFVSYLREFGVEPVVYIPDNAEYPLVDKSLLEEVPSGIKVLSKPIFEPYRFAEFFSKKDSKNISSGIIAREQEQSLLQKMMLYIRGNYFIPDARKFWIKPSVKYLTSVLKEEHFDVLITTGPPHSLHLIGLELQKKLSIKWVADFRDPWTEIGYHKKLKLSSSSKRKHVNLEVKVLQSANHIITTSHTTKNEFAKKTKIPISVITNGFDVKYQEPVHSTSFEISHIGSLLSGRSPENLWKAIAELITEYKDFRDSLHIRLAGKLSVEVQETLENLQLQAFVIFEGYVSHAAAIAMQNKAAVLLLLEIDSVETRGIIPGKIFEYFAARKPILAIGPKNWEAGSMVIDANSGAYLQFHEKEEIKKWILKQFNAYKLQTNHLPISNISKYHRRELTKQLASVIKNL